MYFHYSFTCDFGLRLITIFTAVLLLTTLPAKAQEVKTLNKGSYRLQGACEKTFYLDAASQPECKTYMGIKVDNPKAPMFIFPLSNGAWFFVATGIIDSSKEKVTYGVNKLYDESLNAEFPYPAGECTVSTGPKVLCSVWKDRDKKSLAREILFTGSGNWMFSRPK